MIITNVLERIDLALEMLNQTAKNDLHRLAYVLGSEGDAKPIFLNENRYRPFRNKTRKIMLTAQKLLIEYFLVVGEMGQHNT